MRIYACICLYVYVIHGGQVTSESHRFFIKLYRSPLGHKRDNNVVPIHSKYLLCLQLTGSAYMPVYGHEK